MKPRFRIATAWSPDLAYAVGLIATDGNLSKDGRHILFVSKNFALIQTFKKCLGIRAKITLKKGGYAPERRYYLTQFSDVNFYKFLLSIGLTPAKSKTLGQLEVPSKYFFDFLRGSFDGDGTFYSYWDKRWASSFLFYLNFISASLSHLLWLRGMIKKLAGVKGHLKDTISANVYQLCYAKREAKIVIRKIYYQDDLPRLERKYKKVYAALAADRVNP